MLKNDSQRGVIFERPLFYEKIIKGHSLQISNSAHAWKIDIGCSSVFRLLTQHLDAFPSDGILMS